METALFTEQAKQTGQIFSTGGGIILGKENRQTLKNNGICFLLHASPQTLASRIHNTSKRPLLKGNDKLEEKLQSIWEERCEYYNNCADHIITTDDLNPDQVLNKILMILELSNENN